MSPYRVLPLQVRVDLGVMVMKEYPTLLRSPELEPHHQMWFSLILSSPFLWGLLSLFKGYSQCILRSAKKPVLKIKVES